MGDIEEKISDCLVTAGSTFDEGRRLAYRRAIESESDDTARWVMEKVLENAAAAAEMRGPLCDDTGIPHVILEVGGSRAVTGELLESIELGVREGLKRLPGRPMAVLGEGEDRIGQKLGMSNDPSDVELAPICIRRVEGDVLRAHVLMLGGGPAIRGRSHRIFHRHNAANVEKQIIEWAVEACSMLGCTPCTLAIGVGRSHYEAANLMLQAQIDGDYQNPTPMERRITDAVNASKVGPLGLGGTTTVLGTFIKLGPARASGVRIVCMRPCCCFEPRRASVDLVRKG